LDELIGKIRDLVNEYYPKELSEDKKKSEEKEEQPPEGMPMGDEMGGMDMPEGGIGMPMASSNSLIKVAQSLTSYEDAKNDINLEVIEDLIKEYGKRTCKAIENKHPGCLWTKHANGIDIVDNHETILTLDIGKPLIMIGDNDLLVKENIDRDNFIHFNKLSSEKDFEKLVESIKNIIQ